MKIAIVQICSVLDPETNLLKIHNFIADAKAQQPQLKAVFLPEVFYSMSDGTQTTPYLIEEGNEHFQKISEIASRHQVYLLGGSAATKVGDSVVNRSYNFDPQGKLLKTYDKIHLFAIDLKCERTVLDEAQVYTAGKELVTLEVEDFLFGLSICFDLRFPEMFRRYFSQGAEVFTISSAFTKVTGKAHWLTLLKARAIENQAYVVAAGQWGKHNEKISTWGHSYIIDPWGDIIAECGSGEGFAIAELDKKFLEKVRARMSMQARLT